MTGHPFAAVAAQHEFGMTEAGSSNVIPERPFFRRGLAAMEDDVIGVLKGGIDPKTMTVDRRTAEVVGLTAQSHIQRQIETTPVWAVPNSPATIKAKGSSTPAH